MYDENDDDFLNLNLFSGSDRAQLFLNEEKNLYFSQPMHRLEYEIEGKNEKKM